jgi:hypothetical protein
LVYQGYDEETSTSFFGNITVNNVFRKLSAFYLNEGKMTCLTAVSFMAPAKWNTIFPARFTTTVKGKGYFFDQLGEYLQPSLQGFILV